MKRLSQETLLMIEQNSNELKCLNIGHGMTHSPGVTFDDGEYNSKATLMTMIDLEPL